MTVRWVFSRGGQQTSIDVVCLSQICAIDVQEPDGVTHRTTVPSVIEAMLQQAIIERELTDQGWHLAEFQRVVS